MAHTASQLRDDVERIWRAGVSAVLPRQLIPQHVHVEGHTLTVGDETIDLRRVHRIAIVGAGKASAAMAVALEQVLTPKWIAKKQVSGWVNVPANCVVPTSCVHLHAARPGGMNEPTPEGIVGTQQILDIVSLLGPQDISFCLFSGGGSALLPAPVDGISLDDKIRVTRMASAAGANIQQLNMIRSQLSRVKGGRLAQACRAGRMISLIISDVPGDLLDTIASGPTAQCRSTPADALTALDELGLSKNVDLGPINKYLISQVNKMSLGSSRPPFCSSALEPPFAKVTNVVIGNNALAVDAAGCEAERLGYSHAMIAADRPEGAAENVGRHLAEIALRMRREPGPDCLISGGETTVNLVDEQARGLGGRNQQLALAALTELGMCKGIALLSAGTDGEDGPTDAAGAFVNATIVRQASELRLDSRDYLRRNDAHRFFDAIGGLFKPGPTHTNVCDLRVVLVERLPAR